MTGLVLLVALVLTGECGPIHQGCELAVARTMANRIGTPGFPDTLEDVLTQYYGRAASPSGDAVIAARQLLRGGLRDDKFLFAYSDQDRMQMGWKAGDERLCRAGLCLNLSKEYPG